MLLLCDCSHRSASVSAPGTDCQYPRTTGRGRNSRCGRVLSPWNRRCASVSATPSIVHPDSSEDRERSTSAVLLLSGRRACCVPRRRRDGATKNIMSWIQGVLTSIRREIGPSGNFEKFLVHRARVRDDPGRSPQIELEPERSFDGPLSGQSVYQQTSGVLRHIPATMTQRGLKHHSLLELTASFPPSHPGNRARRQQGPRGPQRSEGRPSLADYLNLCTVGSTEQETARAPTRELEGTSHRSVCISSGTSVVVRAVTSVLASYL